MEVDRRKSHNSPVISMRGKWENPPRTIAYDPKSLREQGSKKIFKLLPGGNGGKYVGVVAQKRDGQGGSLSSYSGKRNKGKT